MSLNISSLLERAMRRLRREAIARSGNPRPGSEPYVSGDGFRALAHHIIEDGSSIDPGEVEDGQIVFVRANLIEEFFENTHPRIANRYVLISHNADTNITDRHLGFIDDKVIHWFAQNAMVSHPKLTPVPIGLENARYAHAGRVDLYNEARSTIDELPPHGNGRILASFNVETNPTERRRALADLQKNPLVDWRDPLMPQKEYVRTLAGHSFVASPPGNGIDCHRTWEAMYVGTVPIVLRTACVEYFKSIGIPLHIVDTWDSAQSLQPYAAKKDVVNTPALYFDYWKKQVLSHTP